MSDFVLVEQPSLIVFVVVSDDRHTYSLEEAARQRGLRTCIQTCSATTAA